MPESNCGSELLWLRTSMVQNLFDFGICYLMVVLAFSLWFM